MAELENNTQGKTPSVYDMPSLLQAKGYLDALADGMDPVTGQPADPDTLSNQNLRSVLHYAALVLADNIRVQEIRTKKATRPFFLTEAQLNQLHIKDKPCLVSDIANEVTRVSGKKLQATWITTWLQEQGYLELKDSVRQATDKGEAMGIVTELRMPRLPNGQQSENLADGYYVNKYSREAQKFILDHMEDILNFHYNGVPVARVDFDLVSYPMRSGVREFLSRQGRYCLITASGSWNPDTGLGSYTAGLCFRENWKVFQKDDIPETSARRCILRGVADAAKLIKKPTEVLLLLSPDPSYTEPKNEEYPIWKEILETLAQARCSIRLAVCQSRGDEIARLLKVQLL